MSGQEVLEGLFFPLKVNPQTADLLKPCCCQTVRRLGQVVCPGVSYVLVTLELRTTSTSYSLSYSRFLAKSKIRSGVLVSNPTTSSMPASAGLAIEVFDEVIATTTSLESMPILSR